MGAQEDQNRNFDFPPFEICGRPCYRNDAFMVIGAQIKNGKLLMTHLITNNISASESFLSCYVLHHSDLCCS